MEKTKQLSLLDLLLPVDRYVHCSNNADVSGSPSTGVAIVRVLTLLWQKHCVVVSVLPVEVSPVSENSFSAARRIIENQRGRWILVASRELRRNISFADGLPSVSSSRM